MAGCQWVGPQQDPRRDFPLRFCEQATITGKSYCADHYHKVYRKGTSLAGRRKEQEIEAEIKEIQAAAELAELEANNDD